MKSLKLNNQSKPGYPNFWPNLVMVLLVLGVPLGVKLIHAASSTQVKSTETMVVPRAGHTAQLLSDGRVLITGGTNANGDAIATTEVFDPTTRTFHVPADGELDGLTLVATPGPL